MVSARNGDVRDCVVRIIDEFKEKGIRAPLSGTSFRPADDGTQYQYYIRVGVTDENSKISFDSIRLVLDEITIGNKKSDANQFIQHEIDQEEIKNLRDDLLRLQSENDEARKNIRLLNHNLADEQRQKTQSTALLQGEINKSHKIREEINRLQKQI